MRILSHIITRRFAAFRRIYLHRIRHFAPVCIVILQTFFNFIPLSIRETVPTPFRLCPQRNAFCITIWESLQTCYIRCKTKFAVANRQRSQSIGFCQNNCVPLNNRFAVNFFVLTKKNSRKSESDKNEYDSFHKLFFKIMKEN